MTFEELSDQLPNGFHDAMIRNMSVDFVAKRIRIEMELLIGMPHTANPEGYRDGTLTLVTPYLFFIEPPDPGYRFIPNGSPLDVDGDSVRTGQNKSTEHSPRQLTLY